MRLVIALICLLLPGVAFPMPMVVPVIGTLLAASTTTILIAQVVVAVGMMAYSAKQKRKKERQDRATYNTGLQDRLATGIAADAPYRYVIGECRVGANIVFMGVSGDKDQYQHVIAVLAHHECQSIDEIYINGKPLGTLDADGFSLDSAWSDVDEQTLHIETHTGDVFLLDGTVVAGDITILDAVNSTLLDPVYVPFTLGGDNKTVYLPSGYSNPVNVQYVGTLTHRRVRVKKHLGIPGEAADATLIAELPDKWTVDHVLPNQTYLYLRFDINKQELQDGPPTIQADMKGMKLYDVRTGTTAYNNNVANALYWYLTSELCNVSPSVIPMSKYQAAANVCDEIIILSAAPLRLMKRYEFNGTITSDQQQSQVLKQMALTMAGGIDATTWEVFAGKYVAPIRVFEQDDIVGGISIVGNTSNADIFNGVRGQYSSQENDYVVTDFQPYQNAAYRAADGVDLYTDLDFPFTTSTQQIHNISRIITERNRNGRMVTVEYSAKAWDLSIGDRIVQNSEFWGWNNQVLIVENIKRKLGAPVELVLQEDAPENWDDADAVTVDAIPNSGLPDPFHIAPLESLTCTSGNDTLVLHGDGTVEAGILVEWPEVTTGVVYNSGFVDIEYSVISGDGPIWRKVQVPGSETAAMISPVAEGFYYWVRGRVFNPALNVKSAWIYDAVLAEGKSLPPENVTGFTLTLKADDRRSFTWSTTGQAVDVVGYRIKFRAGSSSTAWSSMTGLHEGLLTQSPFETANPDAGTYDFAIVAVDSSGNESTPQFINDAVVSAEPTKTVYTADMVANATYNTIQTTGTGLVNALSAGVNSKQATIRTLIVTNPLSADSIVCEINLVGRVQCLTDGATATHDLTVKQDGTTMATLFSPQFATSISMSNQMPMAAYRQITLSPGQVTVITLHSDLSATDGAWNQSAYFYDVVLSATLLKK